LAPHGFGPVGKRFTIPVTASGTSATISITP
jgi:hypothetical protein